MRFLYPFCKQIQLHVSGRVCADDAARQERTAREILHRLYDQPGIILADEVGMGKTFVALAVAVSVALENRGRRPVVVMVPPSLKEKWPRELNLFREKCLPPDLAARVKAGSVERAVDFLKLLDDPPERRRSIIFATHGAMSRGLRDRWVKLAIIYQALYRRRRVERVRRPLRRVLGRLLELKRVERDGQEIWEELLTTHPSRWLQVLERWEIDPEGDSNPDTDDDPVPRAVYEVLPELETDALYEALEHIPRRRSEHFEDRLRDCRRVLAGELRTVWQHVVSRMKLRLPLLVLDEAHHLKNDQTRLASLFHVPEASEDAEELTRGALGGAFERMLFLTATPFQLGHTELCSVLRRFDGINWKGRRAPACGRDGYGRTLEELQKSLDAAQEAAVALDDAWGRLRAEDLVAGGVSHPDVEQWWPKARHDGALTPAARHVVGCFERARQSMKRAEALLQPWVIRHLKDRVLPHPHDDLPRRMQLPGRAIDDEHASDVERGITVSGPALLPFLLAARATSHAPNSRPVFAEGLASSYEAFLHTRRASRNGDGNMGSDVDDDAVETAAVTDAVRWYLDHLTRLIPRGDARASSAHPKLAATVRRVVDTWRAGEKVLVFCHYKATGRTLRQRISEAIDEQIRRLGAEKLGCAPQAVPEELERLGNRFFDQDSPVRRACDAEVSELLEPFGGLTPHRERLLDVVRRNVRTPSFLVRFFPLHSRRLDAGDMAAAMGRSDSSGLTLRKLLEHFFKFLVEHCGDSERERYVDAASRVQTGARRAQALSHGSSADAARRTTGTRLIPNVQLVNGETAQETRQRLMLAFNTPFYPEVLVASSVMAEGVDLHLNCRHMIHHDLCWNPSTLEQRTGRVDRIGAKAERCGASIRVYLPYVAETQDEKMYRVVMDRARWFSVVMGEDYKVDARTTEKLARRVPLPAAAAAELTFQLSVPGSEQEAKGACDRL